MKRNLILIILIISYGISYAQNIKDIETLIKIGALSTAKKLIKSELAHNDTLSQAEAKHLKEELKRIDYIINDYPYTYDEMFIKPKKVNRRFF